MKHALAFLAFIVWAGLASAQTNNAALTLDGKTILQLTPSPAAKLTTANGFLKVASTNFQLYIWAVPDAKTVADALPRAADLIKSEFIQFKPAATNDLEIAGAPAKDLTGPGKEADDEDPGNAEVILFTAGGKVFAACIHGEADDAKPQRAPMLAILKTAKAPLASP